MLGLRPSPPLLPGDRVAVVAPSGVMDAEALRAGVARLRTRYDVVVAANAGERHGYLAGGDAGRRAGLQGALSDPAVRAIWVARGGYGATRLLDDLPLHELQARRCPLVGYSDATALLAAWLGAGVPALHGPHVTELGALSDAAFAAVTGLLAGEPPPELALPTDSLFAPPGGPRLLAGPLTGGNLSVLTALVGTPHLPRLEGSLLFLEEVNERPYRIDRMLTQLRSAGALAGVQAVLVGHLHGCEPPSSGGPTALEVIRERFAGLPVVAGLPAGHRPEQTPLWLGLPAQLDLSEAAPRLRFG